MEDLAEPTVVRGLLDALARKRTGRRRRRARSSLSAGVMVNLAEYAVERRLLPRNPVTDLAWKVPRTVTSVDRRVVVNPTQARELLDAVAVQEPSGARLVAFFGAMYFGALPPGRCGLHWRPGRTTCDTPRCPHG